MPAYKPLVLVVDDASLVLDTIKAQLPPLGYDVVAARSVEQARAQFEQHRVDAVLLDLFLPGFVGHVLLREFKAARPEVPVIVTSGTTNAADREIVMAQGADDVLQESPTVELLAETLKRVLARKHHLAQDRAEARF